MGLIEKINRLARYEGVSLENVQHFLRRDVTVNKLSAFLQINKMKAGLGVCCMTPHLLLHGAIQGPCGVEEKRAHEVGQKYQKTGVI